MTDINEIRKLIKLFMDGETTLEQEATLADYFAGDDIADDLAEYKPMFDYFAEGMPLPEPSDATEEATTESETAIISEPRRHSRLTIVSVSLAAAAAALLLLFSLNKGNSLPSPTIQPEQSDLTAMAYGDSIAEEKPDSTAAEPMESPAQKSKRRPTRLRDFPAPPKTYIAEAATAAIDSAALAEQATEEQLREIERESDALIQAIKVMQIMDEVNIALLEEETYEEDFAPTAE